MEVPMSPYKVTLGDQVPEFTLRNDLRTAEASAWNDFGIRQVDAIFINYCLSKMSRSDAERVIQNASRALKIGGHLRVADLDANNPHPGYQGSLASAVYRTELGSIMEAMARCGFQVSALEFHTADGEFHQRPIGPDYGIVTRSRLIDPRGRDPEISLSSLVVDGVLTFDDRQQPRRMSRADVADVYSGILDRDPDCELAVDIAIAKHETTAQLATTLLRTTEFQRSLKIVFRSPRPGRFPIPTGPARRFSQYRIGVGRLLYWPLGGPHEGRIREQL